jgi:hypothetical protein
MRFGSNKLSTWSGAIDRSLCAFGFSFSIQPSHKVGFLIHAWHQSRFMKRSLLLALLCALGIKTSAQTTANQSAVSGIPQDTAFAVVQRSANDNVWQRTTYEQLPSGEWIPHIHRFQEIATGLNFKNPDTGEWEESSAEIELVPGGAAARRSQHKILFASDIATYGAIDMETPDGQRVQSHLLGLAYYDRASGQSVFIAEITNSIGQLIDTNEVWYDNAFSGVRAAVRYTTTRASFEQDVVLEEQPPAPEVYGLNSATAVLEAFTEFVAAPTPELSTSSARGQLPDTSLGFGTMKIGRGSAFLMGNHAGSTPVSKEWVTLEGRKFLVEEVPIPQIARELDTLPPQNSVKLFSNSVVNVVSSKRLLPAPPIAKMETKKMKVASLPMNSRAFVLDYTTLNTSQTNYTFRGDTTYYISGNVNLYGTNTTFEGNTVLKYASGVSLNVNTPVRWFGTTYRPIVLLAKDDNSVAETLPGSTGSPGSSYYAAKALSFDGTSALTNLNIQNLRVLNATAAVVINGQTNNVLRDLQIAKCAYGVAATNADFSVRNGLFSTVSTNFTGASATGHVEHLTSDIAVWLNKDLGTNLFLTNCILSAVTNLGSCATQCVAVVPSGAGVFQVVGAGGYYLTTNSPYRDAGTTNINPALLALLGRKTTYPPVLVLNSNFNVPTTLGPAIQRDTDTPDLGYHYDPMDYVMSGVNVNSNMTITAGTAIGWFKPASGNPYAVHLADKILMTFNGRLDAQDYFVRTSTVQESNGTWGAGISGFGIVGSQNQSSQNITLSSELDMNFTTMTGLIWDQQFKDYSGYLIVRANNSVMAGGNCGGYVISCYFTNCLMDNNQVGTVQGNAGNEIYLRNCTLHNGYFYGSRSRAIPISVRDCAFDQVTLYNVFDTYSTNSAITDYSYNAYTNAADPFPSPAGASHDQASVSFNWQTGPLGIFYLPTNSVLIDAGHTTADQVGLYHFTTQTNQVKETNSIVDIGYHYVALDTLGNPFDMDGDGIPDYLEDANGNGVVDGGESSWLLNAYNGLSYANGLQVFTPLK